MDIEWGRELAYFVWGDRKRKSKAGALLFTVEKKRRSVTDFYHLSVTVEFDFYIV